MHVCLLIWKLINLKAWSLITEPGIYFYLISFMIFSDISVKIIDGLPFMEISLYAFSNSSDMGIIFFSLINGENLEEKDFSLSSMNESSGFLRL